MKYKRNSTYLNSLFPWPQRLNNATVKRNKNTHRLSEISQTTLIMHSELLWSEFNWIHQQQKQVNPHQLALLNEEGREEVQLLLQHLLSGLVWQLPAVAHQRGVGICRPSLPHPPHQVTSDKWQDTEDGETTEEHLKHGGGLPCLTSSCKHVLIKIGIRRQCQIYAIFNQPMIPSITSKVGQNSKLALKTMPIQLLKDVRRFYWDNLHLHPPPGSSILVSTILHPPAGLQDVANKRRLKYR